MLNYLDTNYAHLEAGKSDRFKVYDLTFDKIKI